MLTMIPGRSFRSVRIHKIIVDVAASLTERGEPLRTATFQNALLGAGYDLKPEAIDARIAWLRSQGAWAHPSRKRGVTSEAKEKVLEIASAWDQAGRPYTYHDVADATGLKREYVKNLISTLRKRGLLAKPSIREVTEQKKVIQQEVRKTRQELLADLARRYLAVRCQADQWSRDERDCLEAEILGVLQAFPLHFGDAHGKRFRAVNGELSIERIPKRITRS